MGEMVGHVAIFGALQLLEAVLASPLRLEMGQGQGVIDGRLLVSRAQAHEDVAFFGYVFSVVLARPDAPPVEVLHVGQVRLCFWKVEGHAQILGPFFFLEWPHVTLSEWHVFIFKQSRGNDEALKIL